MSKKDIKQVEIIGEYGSYSNVIFFNQTIYQNKTRKANGEGYYYTLKTVVPRVIYDYLEVRDDIIYLIQEKERIIVTGDVTGYDSNDIVFKRKRNAKSHNFTIPKQLFDENVTSGYVASFIFVPSESMVLVEFS